MRFVVRQPIFNLKEQVEGYELKLERPAEEEADPEETVATVEVALERLPPKVRTAILCGPKLLRSQPLRRLPPGRMWLVVDPADEPAEALLRVGGELRKAGYGFSLADFEPDVGMEKYLSLVDTVGVRSGRDFGVVKAHLYRNGGRNLRLVAREVSTRSDWAVAEAAGFRYFHGEYFLQPAQELSREVPATKVASLQLLKELRAPVLNLPALENLIKAEPSFCYRLLRYLNSAAFFGVQKVMSLRHAMTLLGDDALRRWLSLMATVASADGSPNEVVVTAMLRARFCELLSRTPDYGFMTGLFSMMPLITNMQLGALLSVVQLPVPVDVALWGEPSPLRTLLDLSLAFERGHWAIVRDLADSLKLTDGEVFGARGEATRWTIEIVAAQSAAPVGTVA